MKLNTRLFLILTLFSIAVAQPATAQFFEDPSAKGFYVGAKAGLNVSSNWVQFNGETVKPGNRTGFNGGILVGYDFNKVLSFHLEALYSQQGANISDDDQAAALHLDYLDVPVLLRLTIDNNPNILPRIYAGPVLGFQMSCTVIPVQSEDGTPVQNQSCGNDTLETSNVDVGLLAGLGVGFVVGKSRLVLDAVYEAGFVNVLENGSGDDSYRNYRFGFTFGIEVPLGR